MQSLLLKLMLATSLLMQCSGSTVQRNGEPKPTSQQVPTAARNSGEDDCDFSAYSPVRISHFDPKAVIKRVQPEYPTEAARRGIQGQVIVKALVNEKGIIERACAVQSEEVLGQAAEKAALQWQLKPGYGLAFLRPKTKKNPKNFAEIYIAFNFKLNKPSSEGNATARQ
jgi:TonB family protein